MEPDDPWAALQLQARDGAVSLPVRVAPRAAREAIGGVHDGALKVSLTAPPVEGAANDALLRLLAKTLGVPRRAVTLEHGEHARSKTVRVEGLDGASLRAALAAGASRARSKRG